MIDNFVRGGYETVVSYELQFLTENDGGFSFPCDKDGNVLGGIEDCAKENLQWCLQHPGKFLRSFNKVRKYETEHRLPNTGTCRCGQRIELTNDYLGACQCPKCGQWYNTSGQELLPPEKWGWDGTVFDCSY